MSRMPMLEIATAPDDTKPLLEKTQVELGRLPNLYKALANSPAALSGYLGFRGALVRGQLDNPMRERLALLVAQQNHCEYCVSAHVFRGKKIGLSDADIAATRMSQSDDPKVAAALAFSARVLALKGAVTEDEYAAVKAAGWSEGEIAEMVAHVALNIYSNYFNHVAKPDLDFTRVEVG